MTGLAPPLRASELWLLTLLPNAIQVRRVSGFLHLPMLGTYPRFCAACQSRSRPRSCRLHLNSAVLHEARISLAPPITIPFKPTSTRCNSRYAQTGSVEAIGTQAEPGIS